MVISDWVRAALEYADMSAAELGRRLTKQLGRSIDRAAVNKMMNAPTAKTKARRVSADEMMAIASITGFPPPADLGDGDLPEAPAEGLRPISGVPLMGDVAAGTWLDPEEMDEPRLRRRIYVPPDPRYPLKHQRAWFVRGRSVEKVAHDGQVLICVILGDNSPIEAQHDDLVIAERRRHQGGLIERTAKRLRIYRDRMELVPEYADEALNVPLALAADQETEVAIVAVAISVYSPLRGA